MYDNILSLIRYCIRGYAQFPDLQARLEKTVFSAHLHILAIGKAASGMAYATLKTLGKQRGASPESFCDGYVLTKYGFIQHILSPLIPLEAGHPLPDQSSLEHTEAILKWLQQLPVEEDLIVLLSGGGSALFELPEAGISLEGLIEQNKQLLGSGLSIGEMNARRKSLSQVKGGKALSMVSCRNVTVYAMSDVVSNDPAVIASGPFTPIEDGVNNGDSIHYNNSGQDIRYCIVGDNLGFLRKLAGDLRSAGLNAVVMPDYITQSAEIAADNLAVFANSTSPGIYLFGGEAPVKVKANGLGGRCTHLALCFAKAIQDKSIGLITFATDGNDNLEGVAGAVVTGDTWEQILQGGIDPEQALETNDSFPALHRINAIIPGYATGINVNDVMLIIKSGER